MFAQISLFFCPLEAQLECVFAECAVAKGIRSYEIGNFLVMKFPSVFQGPAKMYDKSNNSNNSSRSSNNNNRTRI